MDSKNLSCEQHFYSHEVIKQQMAELNANSTDKVCIDQKNIPVVFFIWLRKLFWTIIYKRLKL